MRIVSVMFSAATDGRGIDIDRDTVLSYVQSNQQSIVSLDPAATINNSLVVVADENRSTLLFKTSATIQSFLNFPLSAGERIFVSISAVGSVMLFFTDPA